MRTCKPWQYLQGLTCLKIFVRIGNVGFLIWVFIYCQSRVRLPGFWAIVRLIRVYKILYSFRTFADGVEVELGIFETPYYNIVMVIVYSLRWVSDSSTHQWRWLRYEDKRKACKSGWCMCDSRREDSTSGISGEVMGGHHCTCWS